MQQSFGSNAPDLAARSRESAIGNGETVPICGVGESTPLVYDRLLEPVTMPYARMRLIAPRCLEPIAPPGASLGA